MQIIIELVTAVPVGVDQVQYRLTLTVKPSTSACCRSRWQSVTVTQTTTRCSLFTLTTTSWHVEFDVTSW